MVVWLMLAFERQLIMGNGNTTNNYTEKLLWAAHKTDQILVNTVDHGKGRRVVMTVRFENGEMIDVRDPKSEPGAVYPLLFDATQ